MFSGERGLDARYADIAVSIPPDANRTRGDVQWPSRLPADPAREFVTVKADVLEKSEVRPVFDRLVAAHRPRRALVFVHGYNNSFEDAVYRFAQIVHDSGAPVAPVLFTWPSRGQLLAYNYDRESSTYSRDALEEVLTTLAKDPKVDEISILAHSMGNWVTLETLRQMAIRHGGRLPKKINVVMLAAPDVDVDVFRSQIADIREPRPQFILFVSQDDRALAVSRTIAGNVSRLGAVDPGNRALQVRARALRHQGDRPHQAQERRPAQPRQIRLEPGGGAAHRCAAGGRGFGHDDERQPRRAHRPGDDRRGGDRRAGGGLVLSAPVAAIDSGTRRSYGERVQQLGGTAADTVSATGSTVVEAPGTWSDRPAEASPRYEALRRRVKAPAATNSQPRISAVPPNGAAWGKGGAPKASVHISPPEKDSVPRTRIAAAMSRSRPPNERIATSAATATACSIRNCAATGKLA